MKEEVDDLDSILFLIVCTVPVDTKQRGGGRPGLLSITDPYGPYGHKAKRRWKTWSPVPNSPYGLCDHKAKRRWTTFSVDVEQH